MDDGTTFQLYKLLVEEVREARKARRDLSNAFLTLNLAGVGALGFLAEGDSKVSASAALLFWCAIALIITSWIWRTTNKYYTQLLGAKYQVLYEVEDDLAETLGRRPIRKEYELIKADKPNRVFFSLEYTMPTLFILGYIVFLGYQIASPHFPAMIEAFQPWINDLIANGQGD